MKRNWKLPVAAVCLCGLLSVAYAAGGAEDPLVTLSYLNDIFTGKVERMVDKAVADNQSELEKSLREIASSAQEGTGASFSAVTLDQGQVLTGQTGCEIMLRSGSASCGTGEGDGLADTTAGTVLEDGGALELNHLYMVTEGPNSIAAGSGQARVLVRGPYTIA